MKKIYKLLIFCLIANCSFAQRPSFIKKDSIRSKLDDSLQVFYYDKSESQKAQPLVVELHSWSNSSHSQVDMLAEQAHKKGWNWIFPNFRGVNNHIKACCSDYAIDDIDQAIDWAINNMHIDKNKIYVIGNSGGGYATMVMYMKSRHNIKGFSAWSSISDLAKWYDESVERKNKYGPEILLCTGSGLKLDRQKAWDRSPLFMNVPIKKRKKSFIQIYAGIHDGYTGSVPISHSIDFYNKLLFDFNERDQDNFVSENDSDILISTQNFKKSGITSSIDNRKIHYQKSSKNRSITIFEGGHEILKNAALDLLENK
jgi:pimeloyl-ACP methyl ester carboxylesterase